MIGYIDNINPMSLDNGPGLRFVVSLGNEKILQYQ